MAKVTALECSRHIPLYAQGTSRMLFTRRQSQFAPDAVYIVIIKRHDEYTPSIGFFHHRKHETGFLAYAEFASEIRTVKLERSASPFRSLSTSHCSTLAFTGLTDRFTVFDFVKLADFPYPGKCGGFYHHAQAGLMVAEWDSWICDVLLRLDRQRKEGKLLWRHRCDEIGVLGGLRAFSPKGFVLLTSLSIFTQP